MDNGKSYQPTDKNNSPIPVLGIGLTDLIDGTSASAATTNVMDEDNPRVVRLVSIGDVWVKFADEVVSEEGFYMPSGTVEYFSIDKNKRIAAIGGKLNIAITK